MIKISDLGAVGDGVTDCTRAFAAAARRCGADGGGIVVVPPGVWVTGSVQVPTHTTLRVEKGATVLGTRDPDGYPMRERPWEGQLRSTREALVWAEDALDVAIEGEGTIDGQGEDWWRAVRDRSPQGSTRPQLISLRGCRGVRLEGVRLVRSPSWTVHPWRCREVTIANVTILNPPESPNTDGIDPESCRDVVIRDCSIDVGDDAIVLKAGARQDDGTVFPPCEEVTISGCSITHGHGGVVIGSEMSGGVRNVTVTDCVMEGTDRGIRIKTRRGRGGCVENLSVSNVSMREVGCPVVIHMYYRYTGLRREEIPWVSSREVQPVDGGTPCIRGIRVRGLMAEDVTGPCLGVLYGLPESPIEAVVFERCRLVHRPEPDAAKAEPAMMVHLRAGDYPTCGLFAADVRGLVLRDCELRPRAGERLITDRVDLREAT